MTLQVNMEGRPVDAKLSHKELADAQKEEKEVSIIEDHISSYKSGYQHTGLITPQRMDNGEMAVTIPEEHLKWQPKDVRQRRAEGKKVIATGYMIDPNSGDTIWFLNDADGEAVRQGYICDNCLEWQESHITIRCKSIHGRSCGHERWNP